MVWVKITTLPCGYGKVTTSTFSTLGKTCQIHSLTVFPNFVDKNEIQPEFPSTYLLLQISYV